MKTCTKCEEAKPREAFSKSARASDGLQNCCKACQAEYNAHNKGMRQRRYEKTKERTAKQMAKYYEANREKLKAVARRNGKGWRKANLDKIAAKQAERRATRLRATPAWADFAAIAELYAKSQTLTTMIGEPFHVDHIVPLKSKIVCGLHCEANLQILTGFENMSKNNRHWPDMPQPQENPA